MKYKILILIFMLIMTSGCNAVYTLEINNNTYNETLEINNTNKTTWNNENPSYESLVNLAVKSFVATDYRKEKPESNIKLEGEKYYDIVKINDTNNKGLRYNTTLSGKEYKYSTIVFSNTDNFNIESTKDKIKITSGKIDFMSYPKMELATIKFITNHKVLESNADEIKDNIYYWYFNKNNYNNKKINLEISSDYDEKELKILELDEEGYFGKNTLITLYLIISIIILVTSIVIYLKVKNSNR